MTTRIEMINRAAGRIGASRLQSEAAAQAPARIDVYTGVVEDLLSRYPWSFAKIKRQLARLATVPAAHWLYLYQMPSDMLGLPRAVYDSAAEGAVPITAYELSEAGLASSAEAVWMLYTVNAPPARWPGYFRELITLALAAEFALVLREDNALRNQLRRDCYGDAQMLGEGGLLAQAKNMDAQAQPSVVIPLAGNPLIDVRWR